MGGRAPWGGRRVGVDTNGDLTMLGAATRAFRDRHNGLVFPEAKASTVAPGSISAPLPDDISKP
jgi:hypothetical protein